MSKVVSIATARHFNAGPCPVIEYRSVDSHGNCWAKKRDWRLPETTEAIAAWVGKYREMVAAGYVPEGFSAAPIPISAKIKVGRKTVAKWWSDRDADYIPAECDWRANLKDGTSGRGPSVLDCQTFKR